MRSEEGAARAADPEAQWGLAEEACIVSAAFGARARAGRPKSSPIDLV
jgi:hypothetical protein